MSLDRFRRMRLVLLTPQPTYQDARAMADHRPWTMSPSHDRSWSSPSMLQPMLRCLDGPDRSIAVQAMTDGIEVIGDSVAVGQIEEVCGQPPEEMKSHFPTSV